MVLNVVGSNPTSHPFPSLPDPWLECFFKLGIHLFQGCGLTVQLREAGKQRRSFAIPTPMFGQDNGVVFILLLRT